MAFLIGTLSDGGAERVVSNLSLYLPDEIEREIILFGSKSKIDYPYEGNIIYLDSDSPKGLISKCLTFLKRILALKKFKKQNKDTLMISFLEYPNLMNTLSGITNNSIVSVRNFMSVKHSRGLKSFFWNATIKYLYKKVRNIVVVSNEMKNDLIENYQIPSEKIIVIYNSYPIEKIVKSSEEEMTIEYNSIFNNPTIITAGRLENQKGQQHLLNAFSIVKKKIPNAQLVLLGEGNLETNLRTLSKELNIEDNVHFLGFQSNPFKFISRSKVFVMTSYFEGFPNALAEAMACRIPVISTDCKSGPREILAPYENGEEIEYDFKNNQRYGMLIPVITKGNAEIVENLIASRIIELLNNSEMHKYYSEKSFERIDDFNINKIIDDWSKLMNN